jgi:uncharacterized protein DUF3307
VAWVEAFAVLVVCHLVGDFVLQTEWQATHKRGGLGRNPEARRALLMHVFTYSLAFVPAWVWMADQIGALTVAVAAGVLLPHLVQDDMRLLEHYVRAVKHADPRERWWLLMMVDQSAHVTVLLGCALLAAA